jgi:hypothetical protein
MSNPNTFVNTYVAKIQSLVQMVEDLRGLNDMVDQDSTLFTRYFAGADPRTDINATDCTNAHDAIVQVIFAYDSGSPTQKSFLFKMLP